MLPFNDQLHVLQQLEILHWCQEAGKVFTFIHEQLDSTHAGVSRHHVETRVHQLQQRGAHVELVELSGSTIVHVHPHNEIVRSTP
jgi:hypothetical protein